MKIKKIYLDTNVFLKLFLDESESNIIQQLEELTNNDKVILVISDWVLNECIAVIERKIIEKKIRKKEAFHILNTIIILIEEKLRHSNLELYTIERKHIIGSRIIIQDLNLINASDALHVFIVFVSESNTFLSADISLVNALKKKTKILTFTTIDFNNQKEIKKLMKLLEKN
ncbi:MAG: PIN domain-containing protein [Nitrososphaeraceae archaeon]